LEAIVFESIFSFNFFLDKFILSFKFLCILDHLFDILFRQTTFIIGNCDFVLFTSTFIDSRDIQDTIGINIKSDFDLRNSSWSWWNSIQVEFTKHVVIFCHFSLSFKYLNLDSWLVILISSEDLILLCWNCCISVNNVSHDSSSCFNSERKWGNVKKQKFLSFLISLSSKNSSLDCSSVSNSFIWVD